MKRVAVFIDGSNFYNGLRDNVGRMDVDFHRFGNKMAELAGGDLLRIYYYNAKVDPEFDPDNYEKQQRFITHLAHTSHLTLRLGKLVYYQVRGDESMARKHYAVEKGLDVKLAIDLVRLAVNRACEVAVIVSGDKDLADLIEFSKEMGIVVCSAFFPRGLSESLATRADKVFYFDEVLLKDIFISPEDERVVVERVEEEPEPEPEPEVEPEPEFEPEAELEVEPEAETPYTE
ncbi:MAG: NYN domain-containing protein [Candidatus Electryonea clarkiae]|nr:NYN domain-containing protein [Candidatus Electryonea clarkiae]MDP8287826.1 NYN domain-containing protein [Candidatus Electryonea clarkiae]